MHIVCVGLSHHTASMDLREQVALSAAQVAGALAELTAEFHDAELAILSTCNRTEIYVARPLHGHPRAEQLIDWLTRRHTHLTTLRDSLYQRDNEQAINHLFRVASGLDSMVIGEHQIVGQVKAAYQLAVEAHTAGRTIHRMFQLALATSKRVRQRTGIGDGRSSIAGAAVEYAGHLFDSLADKALLIIGAGKMAELTARQFAAMKPGKLLVTNRTADRAAAMASRLGATAVPWDQLDESLALADVVISSTGSTQPIITASSFRKIHRRRKYRPLFMIDLAVPRDIDPALSDLANVYRYDLDDLQAALARQLEGRHGAVHEAEQIIGQAVGECYALVQTGDMSQMVHKLREQMHETARLETQRTMRKLAAARPEDFEKVLDEHSHRLINKILHRPLSELGRGDSHTAALYATALRRLFDLDPQDLNPPEHTAPRHAPQADEPA